MGTMEYAVAFSLAGRVAASLPASVNKAAAGLGVLGTQIAKLQKTAAENKALSAIQAETPKLVAAAQQQKKALDAYTETMQRSEKPTRAQIAYQKDLTQKLERTKQAIRSNLEMLHRLRDGAFGAGKGVAELTAKQAQLEKTLKRVNRLQEIQTTLQDKAKSFGDVAAKSFGFAAATVGKMTASFGVAAQKALGMEDAMADIRKVVDFPTPDGLEKMEQSLQRMSLTIPMSATGLAQIAAAAGQAGIPAAELEKFTEQAAKMGVAFDITAAEAGDMMAKWRSSMGLTQDQTVELADATNALSNANAAQAKQVGEVLRRYGALGQVAGLTAKQTAALAATAIGAGAEAEVAATGINSFMRALVKGDGMSDLQRAAFVNVGFDPKQLQKDVQENAPKAILSVLEGIKTKIPKELQSQFLTAMFGEEGARAMGPMMVNTELLKNNFALVADATKYTGSMLKEFETRSKTTSNGLALLGNAAEYVAQILGAPLLEPIREVCAWGVKAASVMADWMNANKGLVSFLVKTAAYAGAVAVAGAGLVAVAAKIGSTVFKVGSLAMTAGKALLLLPAFMKGWIGAAAAWAKALGTALTFLATNPIGLAITAVGALIAAGVLLYKNWDTVKVYLTDAWNAISTACTAAWGKVTETFAGVWDGIKAGAASAMNTVIGWINQAIEAVNRFLSFKIPDWVPKLGGTTVGVQIPTVPQIAAASGVPQLADGGVVSRPTLAMIGEGRETEAVMPLSRLSDLLGLGGESAQTVNVSFAPVINITGGGQDAYDGVTRGLNEGRRAFKREFERMMADRRRGAFN